MLGARGRSVVVRARGTGARWGDHLEDTLVVEPGDMLYVPPRETHIVVNRSATEPAEYVVARDSPPKTPLPRFVKDWRFKQMRSNSICI